LNDGVEKFVGTKAIKLFVSWLNKMAFCGKIGVLPNGQMHVGAGVDGANLC